MNILISNYQETKRELDFVKAQKEELLAELNILKEKQNRIEPEMKGMKVQL